MCIRPCAMRSVGCHFKPIAAWLQWYSSAVFWYRFVLRAAFVLSQMVVWGPGRTTQYYALLSPWATSRDKLRHVSNHNLYVRCGRSIRYPLKSLNPILKNLNFYTKTWFPKKSRQINKKWDISSKINIFQDKSRDSKIFQDKLRFFKFLWRFLVSVGGHWPPAQGLKTSFTCMWRHRLRCCCVCSLRMECRRL